MNNQEMRRLGSYFDDIVAQFPVEQPTASLLVTHLLPERPAFVRAVARMSDLRAVLPKPKSISPDALAAVQRSTRCDPLSREAFGDPDTATAYLEELAAGMPVVLLDIGGYFAPALSEVCRQFSGRILGVVEDTENGHQRYAEIDKLPCPVVSVARSPLKDPEDFLVGQSVVFSTEALLRTRGAIMVGRRAAVIGFGKLGSSIARLLHAKGVPVTVYDIDPVRGTQALSQGFPVAASLEAALERADVTICATGAKALGHQDLALLKDGSFVASVTSAEDELDLERLPQTHTLTPVGEHITRCTSGDRHFYLCNEGNAVNFLHGASVGPFIFLVQAEILAGLSALSRGDLAPGLHEMPARDRAAIAATWLTHFNDRTS
ncbi:adenosylhomocysteinase [Streptomyces sp. NRRL S-241]|uniref:adenosylhomocysteinase n=1 Tax=Streptomyces sp. NRRL S-241 TaxID=1463896 RepID=UPI001F453C14|nr:adenosylhomocysteinase [Streptomyces sp. NRRL S-241]